MVSTRCSAFGIPGIAGNVICIGTILFGSSPITAAGGAGIGCELPPFALPLTFSAFDEAAEFLALAFEAD